jgi:hypothetical protein
VVEAWKHDELQFTKSIPRKNHFFEINRLLIYYTVFILLLFFLLSIERNWEHKEKKNSISVFVWIVKSSKRRRLTMEAQLLLKNLWTISAFKRIWFVSLTMASWLKVAEGNVTDLVSLNRLFHLILFQFINFVLDSVNFNSLELFSI